MAMTVLSSTSGVNDFSLFWAFACPPVPRPAGFSGAAGCSAGMPGSVPALGFAARLECFFGFFSAIASSLKGASDPDFQMDQYSARFACRFRQLHQHVGPTG